MSVQSQIKQDIHVRLETMSVARVTWEEGTLRASNEELYAILEAVYSLYAELKGEVAKRRAFASLLTDLGLKGQTNNLPEPRVLLADRGYDSDNIRKTMQARDVLTQIPMRKSRRMRIGVDHSLYSLRNLVERCFNKLKNARRVATRYDKTAESFLGFIDIVSIRLWVRLLST